MIRSAPARSSTRFSRPILLVIPVLLTAIGLAAAVAPSVPRNAAPEPALTQRLGSQTYGFAMPLAWLAAPIPGLRENDVLDVIGTRTGERATAQDVATGLRVMSIDERTVVVELTSPDAGAIAAAHARGLALIPIVRSAR